MLFRSTWGAEDLAIEKEWVGLRGSPTEVAGTKEAAKRERQRRLLDGTAEQQARFVVERVIQPSQSAHPN